METSKIYLIRPLGIRDKGTDFNVGEKPPITTYIAKNYTAAKDVGKRLKSMGYTKIRIYPLFSTQSPIIVSLR